MRLCVKDGVSSRRVAISDVHPWSCIKDIKDRLSDALHVPAPKQRLFFGGRELRNTHTLHDCAIADGATIFLAPTPSSTSSSSTSSGPRELISVYGELDVSADMLECINSVRLGLMAGLAPRLAMEGTGGTYFLRSRAKVNIAVFKAEDEEPFAPSNPRGYLGEMGGAGFRHGLVSGEGAVREVAAYLVDHDGFAGVPPTTRVEVSKRAFTQSPATGNVKRLSNGLSMFANPTAFSASISSENLQALRAGTPSASPPGLSLLPSSASMEFEQSTGKVGSLQRYVEYDEVAGDVAPQLFPAHEVHKIAILDIRLFNIDRNEANILVQRKYAQSPATASRSSSSSSTQADDGGSTQPADGVVFSPLVSPVHSACAFDSPPFTSGNSSAAQTPTLSAATPLSPDAVPGVIELPPAAGTAPLSVSFNLNYPARSTSLDTSRFNQSRPTASIPIPIPGIPSSRPAVSSAHGQSLLSSSVPVPSRLQTRLHALRTMKAQHAAMKPIYHLVPVDHAYTLPDTLELATVDWCWLDWPQAKEPLSPQTKGYVLGLDIKADIELLRRKLAIREECLKVMRISGMLLQKGVAADLTLYDIAMLICRQSIDKPSQLEVLCAQATTLARGIRHNVKRGEAGVKKARRVVGHQRAVTDSLSALSEAVDAAVHGVELSPASVTESEGSSSSDSQDSPPQSADYAHQPGMGSPPPQSSLSRMLQLSRKDKPLEECKLDDDDTKPQSPTYPNSAAFARSAIVPTIAPASTVTGSLRKTQPQPIPAPSNTAARSSLTRSNSLDLILRRSISYDDFRAVRVNKAGFSMNSITTSAAVMEQTDEHDSDEETPPGSVSVKDSTSPPTVKYDAGGPVYRVGGVYHHAEHERRNAWSSEEQSRLFFSCLSGLMDSAIERIKEKKKDTAASTTAAAQLSA